MVKYDFFLPSFRMQCMHESYQGCIEVPDGGQHVHRYSPEHGLPAGDPQSRRGLRRPGAAAARVAQVPGRVVRELRAEDVAVAAAPDAPGLPPVVGVVVRSAAEALAVEGEHEDGGEEEVSPVVHYGGSTDDMWDSWTA